MGEATFSSLTQVIVEIVWKNSALNTYINAGSSLGEVRTGLLSINCMVLNCQVNNPQSNVMNFTCINAKHAENWELCVTCPPCDRGLFLFLQSDQQLDCALDLMRRLPPQQIEKNLSDLIDLVSTGCCPQEVAVTKAWYVRTSSEASRRCGDLFVPLSFGKVEQTTAARAMSGIHVVVLSQPTGCVQGHLGMKGH